MSRRVVLFSAAPWAPRLAAAMEEAGLAVAMLPAAGLRVVAARSFAETDLLAAGCAPEEAALAAAEVPPHCPFAELLVARARQTWRHAAALPELRGGEDFAAAANIIAAALAGLPEGEGERSAPDAGGAAADAATDSVLRQIAGAAELARAGDFVAARRLFPAADIPAARALSLLVDAQTAEDATARTRAAESLRREMSNLSEEEKNAVGAPAFLAAFDARRALEGVL